MSRTSFINARIFDGTRSEYLDESVVVVDKDCIVAVERKLDHANAGDVIDVRGKTLMPGLIDAHCHVLGSSLRVTDTETQPLTYVASYASKMLGHALDCGLRLCAMWAAASLVSPARWKIASSGGRACSLPGGYCR